MSEFKFYKGQMPLPFGKTFSIFDEFMGGGLFEKYDIEDLC
jgi:hypothetical protein